MVTESNLVADISSLIFYLALSFFLLGLVAGWVLWGRDRSSSSESHWYSGHPHRETSVAPLLNPLAYAKGQSGSDQGAPVSTDSKKAEGSGSEIIKSASRVDSINAGLRASRSEQSDASASDKSRIDDSLGLIYVEAPEQADDLTKMKGVGKVLSGKLNDIGIFTYRQIAGWNESNIDAFSKRLSFKDRVQRDDWVGQAKTLHQEKYGENLT